MTELGDPTGAASHISGLHLADAPAMLALLWHAHHPESSAKQAAVSNVRDSALCRCTRMLADLWHAPEPKSDAEGEQPLGTSTIGSSEACMLGGLALKRRWQLRRKKLGLPTDKPNIVMGANAQVTRYLLCQSPSPAQLVG